MKYYYFVSYTARSSSGTHELSGNAEIMSKSRITSMEQILDVQKELNEQLSPNIDFIITVLFYSFLRSESE